MPYPANYVDILLTIHLLSKVKLQKLVYFKAVLFEEDTKYDIEKDE